jgi:hypothetical protein
MRPSSALIFTLALGTACGPKEGRTDPQAEFQMANPARPIGAQPQSQAAVEGSETPSVEVISEDINQDGKADLFYISERGETGAVLVRHEVDLNWDGMVDVRTWLSPEGQITREEMDGDFDGWVDWVDYYTADTRTHSEIDTDYDHSMDLVLYFEGDQIVRRVRDTDGDQKMERIETGDCIEIDENRDGIFETQQGIGCPKEPQG